MVDLLSLTGRVALVTGGGRHIGRGVACTLAAAGAAVVVNDVVGERAEQVAAEITAAGGTAIGLACDVTDPAAVTALVERAQRALGPVDVLVNNAGNAGAERGYAADPPPFWETGPDEWRSWFDVNLFGVMNASRAVLPAMVERRSGRVITIVSDAGRVGEPFLVPYSAAKAGAAGFVRALAKAVGRYDITVNAVSLGTVRDAAPDDEAIARQLRRYVIRRFGTPDDVAAMVLFLASGAASWITGQTMPVNGGYSMAL
ncbi:SDR family NAD(P)-dependent oxidoreductase [Pseudonocardia kunmingensis]|uniref:3-oxoacyl-[acyl-carrier protein] reductase n=1 Tax=Pseudonocardia kunmingensis TaxID=630975 RepID=A0A543DPQ2_9PSEU|nr:SDR family NAD(P)-dependent oxidoreductase [Pseudonocardia kunmingensis]TQM11322.1 3-oxoacyl-[acyl-carrier protein] reductase [Pseudonocardia kunmingensis]